MYMSMYLARIFFVFHALTDPHGMNWCRMSISLYHISASRQLFCRTLC